MWNLEVKYIIDTISWRLIAFLIDVTIVYFLVEDIGTAVSIGWVFAIVKLFSFYLWRRFLSVR